MTEPMLIRPAWLAPPGVQVVVTTRIGGCSVAPWDSFNLGDHVGDSADAVRANRRLLRQSLGLAEEPCWLRQVHGTGVVIAGDGGPDEADASVAIRPGPVCVVLTADCLPVVLAARDGSAVGVVHCGWRGLAAGALRATLAHMPVAAADVVAWLGPAIGPLAFEVGPEVRDAFLAQAPDSVGVAAAFRRGDRDRWFADLFELARCALQDLGVTSIEGGGVCTFTDSGRFYSYRRDGPTGRFATLAWIDPAQCLRSC